jgi:hypothetical protein
MGTRPIVDLLARITNTLGIELASSVDVVARWNFPLEFADPPCHAAGALD